ncbi:MAG: hypothetical protein HYR55_02245 [Acidobacteria bacterium]|nr:hypothetical protein [Acidobacteriota bacterium]MBI3655714.1 hypothetical protein [Acidobacteriota bacterium]
MKPIKPQVALIVAVLLALFLVYEIFLGGLAFLVWFFTKFLVGFLVWLLVGVVLVKFSKPLGRSYFFASLALLGVYLFWLALKGFFFWSKTLILIVLGVVAFYMAARLWRRIL